MFFHQLENFRRALVAVLDRVDASKGRAAHSFRCRRMCRYRPSGVVRGFDRGAHLFLRKGWARWLPRPPAVIRVEFYPISSFADLLARCPNDLVDAARLLRALRQIKIGRQFWAVTSRRHDRAGNDNHPRPGYDALLDRFF